MDPDKVRIKPLGEKDDYRLWRIRIAAVCDSKGLNNVLDHAASTDQDEEPRSKFLSDAKKASNVIVTALSDRALRVVRADIGRPFAMLEKLDERYDSKSTAARIAKMSELLYLRYTSMCRSMGNHIEKWLHCWSSSKACKLLFQKNSL